MSKKVIEIISEKVERDITFLTDVEAKFISLVKHGANRVPFRIVKSEKNKGGVSDLMIVQSILVPKGQSFTSLSIEKGLEWLSDAKKDTCKEYDEYTKYEQMSIDKFSKESLGMIKLSNCGAWAIVGKTVKDEDAKEGLTIGKKEVAKLMDIPSYAGNTPVAEVQIDPQPITFNQVFEKELSSFLDVVKGTLSQTNATASQRRKSIMGALDAFKGFLVMALDAVDNNSKEKNDTSSLAQLNDKVSEISNALKALGKGDAEMGLFKDKQEFVEAVIEILNKRDEESAKQKADEEAAKQKAEADKKAAEAQTQTTEVVADDKMKGLEEKINSLITKVEGVVEKQDKYDNQLSTIPAGTNAGDADNKQKKEKNDSVFSGILSKKI